MQKISYAMLHVKYKFQFETDHVMKMKGFVGSKWINLHEMKMK